MCTFSEGAFLAWLESGLISDVHQPFSILHVKKDLQSKVLQHLQLH